MFADGDAHPGGRVAIIFSLFGAPFWAIFLLGMASRRMTAFGAFAGFLAGAGIALLHQFCVALHWIAYGSQMSADFHAAIYGFAASFVVALLASARSAKPVVPRKPPLAFHWAEALRGEKVPTLLLLAFLLASACVALNFLWR